MLGTLISVINAENSNPKTTVQANPAQNSSWNAKLIIPRTAVKEEITIGLNLVAPASKTACNSSAHNARFLLILSMRNIALFTTNHMRDINPIAKDIL